MVDVSASKPKEKKVRLTLFESKSQIKSLLDVFTGSTALLTHLEVKMPEEWYK